MSPSNKCHHQVSFHCHNTAFTCDHLQLGHRQLVAAIQALIRVVQLQNAEASIRQQDVMSPVFVGVIAALPGHQDLSVPMGPDHLRRVRAVTPQTYMVILRDGKLDRCREEDERCVHLVFMQYWWSRTSGFTHCHYTCWLKLAAVVLDTQMCHSYPASVFSLVSSFILWEHAHTHKTTQTHYSVNKGWGCKIFWNEKKHSIIPFSSTL